MSNLLDTRIATPARFLGPFDWSILSQPFTLRTSMQDLLAFKISIEKSGVILIDLYHEGVLDFVKGFFGIW
ncbi:hypothetical protein H671_5g14890 [Cricetulus griseus]|uniref:Uncharacterized protein n=1 Tax=Cricetulus griseus TaxID=10029 RepID=A0A061I2J8_CRIGR|nr:hypothetical protein H671_5g14890 [Cricetulus griseus]